MTIWKLMAINAWILYKLRLHKSNRISTQTDGRVVCEVGSATFECQHWAETHRFPLSPSQQSAFAVHKHRRACQHLISEWLAAAYKPMSKSEDKLKYKRISSCFFCLIFIFLLHSSRTTQFTSTGKASIAKACVYPSDVYLLIAIKCQFLIYCHTFDRYDCHPLDSKVPNRFQKLALRKRKQPCFLQYRAAPLGSNHRFIFNETLRIF